MESIDHDAGEEGIMPDVNGADADLWAQPLIEYWIWNGTRLIPASADQADRLREMEAFRRLALWQDEQERERRRERRRQQWIVLVAKLSAPGVALQRRLSGAGDALRRKTPPTLPGRVWRREVSSEQRGEHAC
jgi:hypothetical protein